MASRFERLQLINGQNEGANNGVRYSEVSRHLLSRRGFPKWAKDGHDPAILTIYHC